MAEKRVHKQIKVFENYKTFWLSEVSHIITKGWNFMIKSFSSQVVFCFAILKAIFAYVGENWLSQYIMKKLHAIIKKMISKTRV